jgi:hypothetical protein
MKDIVYYYPQSPIPNPQSAIRNPQSPIPNPNPNPQSSFPCQSTVQFTAAVYAVTSTTMPKPIRYHANTVKSCRLM